jgi:hypothetical protein
VRIFLSAADFPKAWQLVEHSMQAFSQCVVTCPSCFESFEVHAPSPDELPTDWDYDCEVCCRPMVIRFYLDGDIIHAEAEGLG